MFNYCGNNPIVRVDDGGESWFKLSFGVGMITGVINSALSLVETITTNPNASLRTCMINMGSSFISGFVAGFVATSPSKIISTGAKFAINVGMAYFEATVEVISSGQFDPLDFTVDVMTNVTMSTFESEILPTNFVGRISSKVSSKRGRAAIVNTWADLIIDTSVSMTNSFYRKISTKKSSKTIDDLPDSLKNTFLTTKQLLNMLRKPYGPTQPQSLIVTLTKPFGLDC